MKWQKLSEEHNSQVFKPSTVGSPTTSSSGQDELIIPDTELQRIHTIGRKHLRACARTHTHTHTHTHTQHPRFEIANVLESNTNEKEKRNIHYFFIISLDYIDGMHAFSLWKDLKIAVHKWSPSNLTEL